MRRISLRSPLAWRAFSGAGLDLPGGGCLAGRCSPLGGILGAAFRGGGVGWFAGGGTPWSTTAPEPETIGGDRCHSSQSTESGRHGRQSMGRQDLGRMDRTTVWSPPGGSPVSESISTIGVPFTETASHGGLVLQLQISDKLNSLWDVVLRSLPWRSDYRVGSASCCGRMG